MRVRSYCQVSYVTLLSMVITGQLAAVQFEAVEGAGAKQKHVLLRVDRLQLLQGGLPAADTLEAHGKA